ncbi:glycosyltransferase family 32 protein [Cyclobacterium plantarum]|uniref:glycosyltransferase family 32 protein n=1 Tax=Cyclobacterium plantarum TaxID=2716263 RepID=UPI003F6FDF55
MIPKIIHYCWFGKNAMSKLELDCIQSWKDVLPEYEIKLWNESNFDFSTYTFSSEAYKLGKYAFVADVCRLHALYQQGGIYLDTDMLVLRDFSELLGFDFIIGEEKKGLISAGIIGSTSRNAILSELLGHYKVLKFNINSPLDIPSFLTSNLNRDKIEIYPAAYFYPLPFSKKGQDYKSFIQPETFAVHLWNHSWKTEWSHLHDKSFGKALCGYFKRIQASPKSIIGDSFLPMFMKYFLADSFSGLYRKYKNGQSKS